MVEKWTEVFNTGDFVIHEAADGGKYLEASLIAAGFSQNTVRYEGKTYQRHYGTPALREAAPKTEGIEIYIGYDEHNDPLDYPKEFGVWKNPRFKEGAIRGDIHVYPDQYWVLDRFKVNPKTLGLSIEGGAASYRYGMIEGKLAADVVDLNIARARLVKNPAAGGEITGIRESENESDTAAAILRKAGYTSKDTAAAKASATRRAAFIAESTERSIEMAGGKVTEADRAKIAESAGSAIRATSRNPAPPGTRQDREAFITESTARVLRMAGGDYVEKATARMLRQAGGK